MEQNDSGDARQEAGGLYMTFCMYLVRQELQQVVCHNPHHQFDITQEPNIKCLESSV